MLCHRIDALKIKIVSMYTESGVQDPLKRVEFYSVTRHNTKREYLRRCIYSGLFVSFQAPSHQVTNRYTYYIAIGFNRSSIFYVCKLYFFDGDFAISVIPIYRNVRFDIYCPLTTVWRTADVTCLCGRCVGHGVLLSLVKCLLRFFDN